MNKKEAFNFLLTLNLVALSKNDIDIMLNLDSKVTKRILFLNNNIHVDHQLHKKFALSSILNIEKLDNYSNEEKINKELKILETILKFQKEINCNYGYYALYKVFQDQNSKYFNERIANIFKYCRTRDCSEKLNLQLEVITNWYLYETGMIDKTLALIEKINDEMFCKNIAINLTREENSIDNKFYFEFLEDITNPENRDFSYFISLIYGNNKYPTIEYKRKIIKIIKDCNDKYDYKYTKEIYDFLNNSIEFIEENNLIEIATILVQCESGELLHYFLDVLNSEILYQNNIALLLVKAVILKETKTINLLNLIIDNSIVLEEDVLRLLNSKLNNISSYSCKDVKSLLEETIYLETRINNVLKVSQYLQNLNKKIAEMNDKEDINLSSLVDKTPSRRYEK